MKPEDINASMPPVWDDPWGHLATSTAARIALGRCGVSLPTVETLRFALAHAQARDAVHTPLDSATLAARLADAGFDTLQVASQARDRHQYLQRPDLGRRLDAASRQQLSQAALTPCELLFVVGDGLSSRAIERHALPLLSEVRPFLEAAGWRSGPVVLAQQARVALGDDVGGLLGSPLVVMLIGERPGLSSPDSMGIYLTFGACPGRLDSERNCISNVRPEGLGYAAAAHKLVWLLNRARQLGLTGVGLKDESDSLLAAGEAEPGRLTR